MSVLVRAAKAAARVKHLSHEGVPTGPLLMFAGTLTRHLAAQPWDYVVVAWEGVSWLNWRKERYPAYKSNRPSHAEDAPEMSQDEELAREFCTAAGLYQDWSPSFEGDDIIAAWWRAFRADIPAARITILTSDRDLWQLCDEMTACQGWQHREPVTAAGVYELWGVEPARLPLLRALAGDPSDGMPGIRGIGHLRAMVLAGTSQPQPDVIGSLALDEAQKAEVRAWYAISELRDPETRPELYFGGGERARWNPARHSAELRAFLWVYGMERMIARLDAGKLPWPPFS
jgi:5'-3' exonuclease